MQTIMVRLVRAVRILNMQNYSGPKRKKHCRPQCTFIATVIILQHNEDDIL